MKKGSQLFTFHIIKIESTSSQSIGNGPAYSLGCWSSETPNLSLSPSAHLTIIPPCN